MCINTTFFCLPSSVEYRLNFKIIINATQIPRYLNKTKIECLIWKLLLRAFTRRFRTIFSAVNGISASIIPGSVHLLTFYRLTRFLLNFKYDLFIILFKKNLFTYLKIDLLYSVQIVFNLIERFNNEICNNKVDNYWNRCLKIHLGILRKIRVSHFANPSLVIGISRYANEDLRLFYIRYLKKWAKSNTIT